METLRLRDSDLRVSRVCMGCCPMGGYNWGDTREEDFIAAIHAALDAGVNFFDTADTYGLGQSETTLARGLGGHRRQVVIQTKFGVRARKGQRTVIDSSPAHLRQALEDSLRRLKTDYIDIYMMHYWDRQTPPEDVVEELLRQKAAGKIRCLGLSNADPALLARLAPYKSEFVTLQREFSLCCRKWEEDLRRAEDEMDVTPLTWGSLGQGMLSGKYDESSVFASNDRRSSEVYVNFHGEKLKHNLRIVEALRQVADSHGQSCASTAMRFILDYLPRSVAIVGIKRPAQIRDISGSQGWQLTGAEMAALNAVSLADGEE